jgi:hypothetical protein
MKDTVMKEALEHAVEKAHEQGRPAPFEDVIRTGNAAVPRPRGWSSAAAWARGNPMKMSALGALVAIVAAASFFRR